MSYEGKIIESPKNSPGVLPKVSFLLCSYNRAEKVEQCLSALKSQSVSVDSYEVVCINDGSTDLTGEKMLSYLQTHPGIYVEHDRNRALAAARNTAIKASRGELLAFINDDTYPTQNFVEEHLKTHEARVGESIAVFGVIPFIDSLRNRLFSRMLIERNLYFSFTGKEENKVYPFWNFITGNLSVPRRVFLENDIWFDETFLRYGFEDIECGYRLCEKGLRIFHNPRAEVIHDHKITIENYVTRAVDNAINLLQFAEKHRNSKVWNYVFGVESINDEMLGAWKLQLAEALPKLEHFVNAISSIQETILPDHLSESDPEVKTIIDQAAQATEFIGEVIKLRTFVETLTADTPSRKRLVSGL